MIFSVASTVVMGGLAGWSFLKKSGTMDDAERIKRVFQNSGLSVSDKGEKRTIRLYKRRGMEGGIEYIYQMPLGMSFKQVKDHKHVIEDGLNIRVYMLPFSISDLKKLKFSKGLLRQVRELVKKNRKARKEIELEFDGMLRIQVYDEPLTKDLPWSDSMNAKGWIIPVGQSRVAMIYHDFEERPHIIIAGATGFGKSQFLKMLITSLITIQPDDVTFSLIDLKGGTAFQRFANAKQVKHFGKNPGEALEILKCVQSEMNTRLEKIVSEGFEDVKEAGDHTRHFIVIDEAADIAGDKACMEIVTDIARRGRAAGYRLVYATQYPTNETLPSQVRQNIGARVCFVLETTAASLATLDEKGAEDLPEIPGRAIYKRVKPVIVQTPYMTNKQVEERLKPHITIKGRDDESESLTKNNEDPGYSLEFEES